jgi:hypothetical protein
MIYTGIIYEDGKYWVYHDGKGFVICRNKGACSEVVGFAGTFEQAKESIDLQRSLRNE